MRIQIKDGTDPSILIEKVKKHFGRTRFNLRVCPRDSSAFDIYDVRLKKNKSYCGNHPNACERNPYMTILGVSGPKPKKLSYLEGSDWVDFNDRLNDLFDRLKVNAVIYSSTCQIRRGTKRRVRYGSFLQGFTWFWERIGDEFLDYRNYMGQKAPKSTYPEGTPGSYTRRVTV